MTSERGFTLIEIIIVIGIIAILTTVAVPTLFDMRRDAIYRETSRNILYLTRQTRSLAIESNRERRLQIVPASRLMIVEEKPGSDFIELSRETLPPNITLKSGVDCNSNSIVFFSFNPNGSSNQSNICIMENNGTPRYRIGISFANTGRARIDRKGSAAFP